MVPARSNIGRFGLAAAAVALLVSPDIARADESGISFWLPGLYGSLSATPTTPGWSVATIYYHTSVNASGAAAASPLAPVNRIPLFRNLNLNLGRTCQAPRHIVR